VGRYYCYQSLVYFMELGGIIIVASAAFTLAMMNHTNELTAMLAAGVSLHRVSLPIVICSMVMGGLVMLDQELLIPRVAPQLVMSRDERLDTLEFEVKLISDSQGSIFYARQYNTGEERMWPAVVMTRDRDLGMTALLAGADATASEYGGQGGWLLSQASLAGTARLGTTWQQTQDYERIYSSVGPLGMLEACRDAAGGQVTLDEIGQADDLRMHDAEYGMTIHAERFVPVSKLVEDSQQWGGVIHKPQFTFQAADGKQVGSFLADEATWEQAEQGQGCWRLVGGRYFYPSDLTPDELVLRESSNWMDYMSTTDLTKLMKTQAISDRQGAEMIKHSRFTAPLNNLLMLLLGLPFILSRERNIKASATLCLLTVAGFFALIFICRYMGLSAILAAWLPIFLFGPVAIIMFDSVKT